ncbi:NAD-dependent epimerase/dehydratase family protein [Streptomyces sp. NRRL WC-3742]|uniref:NAD-dependent epimerase/dehydratase family protein n=1 Tax=Streptomyces sp. NRRL WC-3742 TaxID=1463934 RepID=UPI0004CAC853|nr:NAD-dependent epimerase/dehydratase family protein [Streptomyces sp. NRRL WC-3742]
MSVHVVVGYGPAGAALAQVLAGQGHQVRVVTRTGGAGRAVVAGVEHVAADAADASALTAAARGAVAVYGCAAPPLQRWGRQWPALASALCAAAEASGAVLVMLGNLYGYGPVSGVLREDLPLAATGRKGRARARVWEQVLAAHEAGRVRAVEARASDFFGPGVTGGGHLAERVVPLLLRGRAVSCLGDPDAAHSWTYVPDVARAMAELAGAREAWGRAWHVPTAPALSVRQMAALVAEEAGAGGAVRVRGLSPLVLGAAGLVSPVLRELREVRYQFDGPFVVDCSAYEGRFGVRATPVAQQVAATVAWWRERAR